MAYIRPLDKEDMDQELQALYDHYENTRGFMPNSIRTMARRPEIAKAFGALNKAIIYQGTVAEDLKILISLISSVASGCRYCQSHMANLSSIYNISDEKIAAIWTFERSDLFTDAEKAALNLALKSAYVPNESSAEDFDELKKYYDEGQIVEIVASISLFGYLNRWNDTMATQLEDVPAKVADRTISSVGWDAGKHS
jgi:uncharacterized peroxidase-related enzyme